LNSEVEGQVQTLKTHSSRSLSAEHHDQLSAAGLALWNWCTREKRRQDGDVPPAKNRFFCLVRLLSFSMLVLARRSDDNSQRIIIHLERLAIKTGRSCIANNELEFGLWALQKAVEYNGLLQPLQGSPPEDWSHICSQFEVEYSTLRIAWKEDRMDVAEHVYGSLERLVPKIDAVSTEQVADALFEIGRDLALKKNFVLAGKWLERSYELINAQKIGQLSRDAIELRLAISQALIQVYLDIGSPDYMSRAENHIAYIESELGDKLIVLLFRTEILIRSPAEVFDSEAYADTLRRMMRTADMSESFFKLLIHHIRKLDERNHLAAISVLDDFFIACILASQQEQWIDKAIILRTHLATSDGSLESIQGLEIVLDKVLPSIGKPLSVNAAVGIHTLIWKKADAEFSQDEFHPAARWCNLALHPALAQSGPSNVSKMARKLLLCAIQLNDLSTAGNILQGMSDVTLKEPMTAYLAFKVALKQQDADNAFRCLEQISEAPSTDHQYLYACCLEAQQAQDKIITIKALQHIVLKHRFHSSESVHLPALLRVLIRLEVSVLNDDGETDRDKETLVEDLCNVFKAAADEIQKERRDNKNDKLFTIEELDWFCKNAYNIGLENTMIWEARHVIAMLECCLSIVSSYPPDIPAQMAADNSLRGMFCNFMAATVLLALARSEDNVESRLQDYLNMRNHVKCFHETLESRLDALDEVSRGDLQIKLSSLLVFEFEGATCLKLYPEMRIHSSARQATRHIHPPLIIVNSILVLYQTMRELINQIWTLESFGHEKLAKYMRCLLKATLPMEHKIPLNLIEEISTMNKKNFPPMELEWIIITAFNHGVDLFGVHEDELSKVWIFHALTIAHYLPDGGELERQLQEKHTRLKWDDVHNVEK
ncbi:meiosis protein SPO22/ZIP4 like-domain-containing protein, partial [Xylaria flabelliformis]